MSESREHLVRWPFYSQLSFASVAYCSHFGEWSCFRSTSTCYLPSRYYFPLLSLLAFTPPSLLLRSLRTTASWLCLALISFCQAFVFDHHSSVSSLLLLLSTSFPSSQHFWLPPRTGLRVHVVSVHVCVYVFLMFHAKLIFVGIFAYGWVSWWVCVCKCVHKMHFFSLMIDKTYAGGHMVLLLFKDLTPSLRLNVSVKWLKMYSHTIIKYLNSPSPPFSFNTSWSQYCLHNVMAVK